MQACGLSAKSDDAMKGVLSGRGKRESFRYETGALLTPVVKS